MIYFLIRGEHTYTVSVFQQHTHADFLRIVAHEMLHTQKFLPEDIVIFCDIDRCNDEQLRELISASKTIRAIGCRILNDPSRVMRRYELLRGLKKDRSNDFMVYRPGEISDTTTIRFPVFLRDELEHNGPGTELIHDFSDLKKALTENPPPNPLVCEFIDTTTLGHFHKYGAFVLNGKIIPRHFFLSGSWNVKSASGNILQSRQMEIDYVTQNPHEKEMQEIAAYAHIDFGRIDYAITEKGFQVFEINTNPTVIDEGDIAPGNPREFITNLFIEKLTQELKQFS